MFNLRLCTTATIRYFLMKVEHIHLCGIDYKCFSPHCCKCNSLSCTAAIRCGSAYHGPHSDSVYSGSEHKQLDSSRLVKHEVGFPNPRRALIGSNPQLWRLNDLPYYREYTTRCQYNTVQFNMILNIAPVTEAEYKWEFESEKTSHILPLCVGWATGCLLWGFGTVL